MTRVHDMTGRAQALLPCILRAAEKVFGQFGATGDAVFTLSDDATLWRLNREFRGIDKRTDVLTFAENNGLCGKAMPAYLGEVIISLETARRQAQEYGHTLEREVTFLAVHGALHLLGFDHERSEEDERSMFMHQEEIMKLLALPR